MSEQQFPEQAQDEQPGAERAMDPEPEYIRPEYQGVG